jgi:hypothetical protein
MSYPTKSPTPPADFSGMNITDEDPVRRASPDQTMVSKGANNGGYHAGTEAQPKSLIVSHGSVCLRRDLHTLRSDCSTVEEARVGLSYTDSYSRAYISLDRMQPSYAQDMGVGSIEHGVYGSFINALGLCLGVCGAIPCCPFPNPYKRVEQGSVGLISRFGQFYKVSQKAIIIFD